MPRQSRALPPTPFRRFDLSAEVIRLVVGMYVRLPLSLRNVEDLLAERRADVHHETVRFWLNRFGSVVRSMPDRLYPRFPHIRPHLQRRPARREVRA